MRFGVSSFLIALLLTAGISAEGVSIRRVVSHDPPSNLEERILTSAVQSGSHVSLPDQATNRQVSAATVVEFLPNGDFESGAAIWTESSMKGWPLILHATDIPTGIDPFGGDWAVWLGGDNDEIAYIQQQVTVPAGSPTLNYWHWIDSEDECGYDFGSVRVNSTTVVESYDLCWPTDTAEWVLHSIDMSAYTGQTLNLQIRIETDDQLISNLFVDDVYFETQGIFADGFESGDTSAWSTSMP